MKCAVIVNSQGEICAAHDEWLASKIQYVRYDQNSRDLIFLCEDRTVETVDFKPSDQLHGYLLQADYVVIVFLLDKKPQTSSRAPLLVGGLATSGDVKTPIESSSAPVAIVSDQVVAATYDVWRAKDYSWDGLAKKRWSGWAVEKATGKLVESRTIYIDPDDAELRQATLQDYWRDQEGHLIEGDGKRWTRIHCPLHWQDGSATAKATWSDDQVREFSALIAKKFKEGRSETGAAAYGDGIDRRAQFQGAILLGMNTTGYDGPLAVCFDRALFVNGSFFRKSTIAEDTSFASATFLRDAEFDQATFLGDAHFSSAKFLGLVSFDDTCFRANAHFGSATFYSIASFHGAKIEGTTAFFVFSTFCKDATFRSVVSNGDFDFSSAEFRGRSIFSSDTIRGRTFFNAAKFRGDARFELMQFEKEAQFSATNWQKKMSMVRCNFSAPSTFDSACFSSRMDFSECIFQGTTSFESITWPTVSADWHASFKRAWFRGAVSFIDSGFCAFAAFDGAVIERGLALSDAGEKASKKTFLAERTAAMTLSPRNEDGLMSRRTRQALRENRLKELERGCRVMKLAMSNGADKHREQVLYKFELMARRAQRNIPLWEKVISYAYGITSGYGASLARPLISIGVILILFAVIFWGLGNHLGLGGTRSNSAAWQAWDMSWINVFRPLSSLYAEGVPKDSLTYRLMMESPPSWGALVRVLSTLESLVAVLMAFLFGLAVRRRFQIL